MDKAKQERRHDQPNTEFQSQYPPMAAKRLVDPCLDVTPEEDFLAETSPEKQPEHPEQHVGDVSMKKDRQDQRK
jgi:hypothetical protein